jgi:hypothetical protein
LCPSRQGPFLRPPLEPFERVSRATLQRAAEQLGEEPTLPSRREFDVSAELDARSAGDGDAGDPIPEAHAER